MSQTFEINQKVYVMMSVFTRPIQAIVKVVTEDEILVKLYEIDGVEIGEGGYDTWEVPLGTHWVKPEMVFATNEEAYDHYLPSTKEKEFNDKIKSLEKTYAEQLQKYTEWAMLVKMEKIEIENWKEEREQIAGKRNELIAQVNVLKDQQRALEEDILTLENIKKLISEK